eukprot:129476_1
MIRFRFSLCLVRIPNRNVLLYIRVKVVQQPTVHLRALLHKPPPRIGAPSPTKTVQLQCGDVSKNSQLNSSAKSHIMKFHVMSVDPLDPPRFRHKKLPGGPPSPPVPVMHSPPRKVTVQDQQNWKIPPCISNWKNIKGYTIPLDKRLASDGRGLQEKTINENFAKLSESLYIAERTARQEVEERAKIRTRLSRKKKLAKERELQDMARAAREKRAESAMQQRDTEAYADAETKEQAEARLSREDLRKDRMRDRRREYRMEDRSKSKRKGMGDRNKERDVSEKIALGQHVGRSKDSLYDQRLFNQDQGMSAGFRGEESYDIYDKPLFKST